MREPKRVSTPSRLAFLRASRENLGFFAIFRLGAVFHRLSQAQQLLLEFVEETLQPFLLRGGVVNLYFRIGLVLGAFDVALVAGIDFDRKALLRLCGHNESHGQHPQHGQQTTCHGRKPSAWWGTAPEVTMESAGNKDDPAAFVQQHGMISTNPRLRRRVGEVHFFSPGLPPPVP